MHTRVLTPAHTRGHVHALAHYLHVHNCTRVPADTQVYPTLKEAAEQMASRPEPGDREGSCPGLTPRERPEAQRGLSRAGRRHLPRGWDLG